MGNDFPSGLEVRPSEDARLEVTPIVVAREQPSFVMTPYIRDIVKRATLYLRAGFPLHFRGPTGTGKTTLAMYIAGQLERPVMLVHGDEEFGTSDLIGGEHGYRKKRVVDNFIHSVLKTEEDTVKRWIDNRVTVACKHGFTLIYDEFTRSRAEANNVLLSILEEKILDLPAERGEESYLRVHPDFSAIFTSNPEEYAGVHKAQDALIDRMITINLGHYDRETEIAITKTKSKVSSLDAQRIVDIVRDFRETGKYEFTPTIRASVMIAKVIRLARAHARIKNQDFIQTCLDILASETGSVNLNEAQKMGMKEAVMKLIKKYCSKEGGI